MKVTIDGSQSKTNKKNSSFGEKVAPLTIIILEKAKAISYQMSETEQKVYRIV
jgi:hypothetical protein